MDVVAWSFVKGTAGSIVVVLPLGSRAGDACAVVSGVGGGGGGGSDCDAALVETGGGGCEAAAAAVGGGDAAPPTTASAGRQLGHSLKTSVLGICASALSFSASGEPGGGSLQSSRGTSPPVSLLSGLSAK